MLINDRVNAFYGLNNYLNPASAAYKEGMAYVSDNARIDETGCWSRQQSLEGISGTIQAKSAPTGGGVHYKFLSPDGTGTIVDMPVATSCDVGPNWKLYSTNGLGYVKNDDGDVTGAAKASFDSDPVEESNSNSRARTGTYYYMLTQWDDTYKRESLPSAVKSATLSTATKNIGIGIPAPAEGYDEVRLWRSKVSDSDSGIYHSASKFYFVDSFTGAGTKNYDDIRHDEEIADIEYDGRGTAPPQDIDYLVAYNNRMLYFKGNTLYWSSAGRPEEVAQDYTIKIDGVTVECTPKLSIGLYAEAKYEISELSGQTVTGAIPYMGDLYVFTNSLMGVIVPTSTHDIEGYRFHVIRRGVGVTSDKTLALTPYGLFGADQQGIWKLTGRANIERISEYRVDIYDTTKSTYMSASDKENAFGCWIPALNEYWYGQTNNLSVIAYQAQRDAFVGPYSYSSIQGGCAFVNENGAQAYLGGLTPSLTDKDTGVDYDLQFWLGQAEPTTIKDRVTAELVFVTTPDIAMTLEQNSIPSDSTEINTTEDSDNLVKLTGESSGRFFKVGVTGSGKMANMNYRYNPIEWVREEGR